MQDTVLELIPSQRFLKLYLSLMVATLGVILFLPCSGWIKWLGIFVAIGYGIRAWPAPCRALLPGKEIWELHYPDGVIRATLCGSSTVTRFICILRFRVSRGRYRSCILCPDSFHHPADYRRMVVYLKFFGVR